MKKKKRTIKIYVIEEFGQIRLAGKIDQMRKYAIDHFKGIVANSTPLELEEMGMDSFSLQSLKKDEDAVVQYLKDWDKEISVIAEVSEKEFKN